ncbi:MAG: cobalt ECF transporter T component CbiQ [Methanosarcinales archaeon]
MHVTLSDIEREAYKKSIIHNIDGRIKIILTLSIIVYAVSLPRLELLTIQKLVFIELYLFALMALAHLNPLYLLIRFMAVIPFGGAIVLFQPFIHHSFFESYTVLYTLPFGLTVTLEGFEYGSILFSKFLVCITSIFLLSSTTKMQDMVNSARRLGLPREFALLLGMMVRYLFVFYNIFKKIRTAQKTRCFSIFNKKVPKKWILEQIGYTVSSIFIRSYEQGERTYVSMLGRGYTADSSLYVSEKKIRTADVTIIGITFFLIIGVHFFIV